MFQKFVFVPVFCCIFAVQLCLAESEQVGIEIVTPVPVDTLVKQSSTTTMSPKDLMPSTSSKPVVGTNNIWLNSLLNPKPNNNDKMGPSLVVEVDDTTNEAALKIMNLPLVRTQTTQNVLKDSAIAESEPWEKAGKLTALPEEQMNFANLPKSRHARDIDFEIYDKKIIQALIDALRKVDPSRADIIQHNIQHVSLKVEIDDDDDWINKMKYAMGHLPFF